MLNVSLAVMFHRRPNMVPIFGVPICVIRSKMQDLGARRFLSGEKVNRHFRLTLNGGISILLGHKGVFAGTQVSSRGPAPAAPTQSSGLHGGRHFGAAHRPIQTS